MVVMVQMTTHFLFQMFVNESQEGYKQPTDSGDSALMLKVEAFFPQIDIKTGMKWYSK